MPTPDDEACEELAQEVYLQALAACIDGQDSQADSLLGSLGCCWRLAPAIWDASRSASEGSLPAPIPPAGGLPRDDHFVMVAEDALPAPLLAQLQAGFAPDAAFWRQHAYDDPGTPFFSFVYPMAAAPSSALEAAVQVLARQLRAAPATAPLMARVTHCEWWAHRRPLWAAHQLHWDANEALMRRGRERYRLLRPAVSSVLYLASRGGPTLVLDQVPRQGLGVGTSGGGGEPPAAPAAAGLPPGGSASPRLAGRAWLARPRQGRLAAWPGNLLHGVLPSGSDEPDGTQDPLGPEPVRTTLMLAWWSSDPVQDASQAPGPGSVGGAGGADGVEAAGLGPYMVAPPASPANWLAPLELGAPGAEAAAAADLGQAQSWACSLLPAVSPAWQRVPGPPGGPEDAEAAEGSRAMQRALQHAPLPPLRFFLRDDAEVQRAYVPDL